MANYFDIRNAEVLDGAKYAVDTQIIYWCFYAPDTPCEYDTNKINDYLTFVGKVASKGKIVITSSVLNELFKIIEINEYRFYLTINGYNEEDFGIKQYREIDSERETIKNKMTTVFGQINAIAEVVYDCDSNETALGFIEDFLVHKADYVDYSLVRYCERRGIKNVLTDDKDFKTIHNSLNIYSANKKYFPKA